MKCDNCKEKCPQEELACEIAKGRMFATNEVIRLQKELDEYQEIGTVKEFKILKEKNTPMELAEHNFQDEVHHYLCPSCRNIVSHNQNYCEECGQRLEV